MHDSSYSQVFTTCYLKPSYLSGTLILVILVRGLVIAKFNMRYNFAMTRNIFVICSYTLGMYLSEDKTLKASGFIALPSEEELLE